MACTKKKSLLLSFALIAGAIITTREAKAQATEGKRLLLKEAVSAALEHNATLKVSGLETRISQSNYRQMNAVLLPHIEASYAAMTTNNALNAFGFKLQQENVSAADFNPVLLNNPGRVEDFGAKIEIQQPLLNVDRMYQRAAAGKQQELYRYKQQRTREYVQFDVQKTYLDLQLAYSSVAVLEESLRYARQIETNTRNYFIQGLIKKSDLLNVQVNVATVESHLAKAKSLVSGASDALALAMGDEPGAVYLTDSLSMQQNEVGAVAAQVAPDRSDLMAMKKAVEATRLMEQSEKMALLPRINAFGNFQTNDAKYDGFNANSYLVGMKLSWTLFDGSKTLHAINARKAERRKLEVQLKQQQDQSQTELNKAHRDRLVLLSELNRQNLTVQQAQESLRILQDRYNEGLVSTTDLLMAHAQLLQQKLLLSQTIYGSNLTLAYLEFLGAK